MRGSLAEAALLRYTVQELEKVLLIVLFIKDDAFFFPFFFVRAGCVLSACVLKHSQAKGQEDSGQRSASLPVFR